MRLLTFCLTFAFPLGACSDDDGSCTPGEPGCVANRDGGIDASDDASPEDAEVPGYTCNPVGDGTDCLLPFPSNVFLSEESSTETGHAVNVPAGARPSWNDGAYNPTGLYEADGFSVNSQIMFGFSEPLKEDGLTNRRDDFSETLETTSSTLLIEADTGTLVPHFAEIDARDTGDNPVNLIRPAYPLNYETRYIVVTQNIRTTDDEPMPPTPGFAALRDKADNADPELQARYEADIFPIIEQVGVSREGVQLAWDFTTGSSNSVKRRMLSIRDTVRAWLDENEPMVQIDSVEDHERPEYATRITGTLSVPAFIDSTELGARFLTEPDTENLIEVPFLVNVPQSVADGEIAGRALQFGHGFFGDFKEIDSSFHASFANTYGFVHFAIDWWGMSRPDQGEVVGQIMTNMDETAAFGERVHQAIANQLVLTRAIKTTLAQTEALQLEGEPLYDAENVYYYGISGGSMLGTVFLSMSDEITRASLNVGGGPWTLIASRSTNFAPFLAIIFLEAKLPRLVQEITAMLQLPLDLIDPITYSEELQERMRSEQDPLVIAVQAGIGDTQVPNVSTEQQVRSLGIPTLLPSDYNYFDRQTVEGPTSASAVTWFDFGIDPLPGDRAVIGTENSPAHAQTRKTTASQEQLDRLFRPDGQIEQPCDGVCDPE